MKRYQITLAGQTFDVSFLSDPNQEQVQVDVNGRVFTVGVRTVDAATGATAEPVLPTTATPAAPPAQGPSAHTVTSPLPGVIKSIAVREGQRVSFNEPLIVIEAMKMDNVIRAQREGTIATIYVGQGQQVAHGEALLAYAE